MITKELLYPNSIVVVGASNDIEKPGGKILKNLLDGNFKGDLFAVNPKVSNIQNIETFNHVEDIPEVELAIIAIAAKYIPQTVDLLAYKKKTKAFIIISAGFSEESKEGAVLERKIVETINNVNGSLIGPNCTGVLTSCYHGIFTLPIPKLDPKGCDLISGSGATACFILESAIPKGLTFSSVISVGNSAQMGIEEILQYMDENFNSEKDSKIKLLYMESISNPKKLLKHSLSLIKKGCKIAAIKAGVSEAGSRAASSHTGALASSDLAVNALFKKTGIIRCYGREELISVGSVFMYPEIKDKNIAIITHAGGPAVMLTDTLSKGGLSVPAISGQFANELLEKLYPGSSVANPIDFLATGTAEQLGHIIDCVNNKFDSIDGMVVIFGTPGLSEIFDVYELLDKKIKSSKKPIFPVLPSGLTAGKETKDFISKGNIIFSDEVVLGKALSKVYGNTIQLEINKNKPILEKDKIRNIINNSENGYISPDKIQKLLDAAGIPRTKEIIAKTETEVFNAANDIGFPLVMKVVGPVHKSDVGGVALNITDHREVEINFKRMMQINEAEGILLQPMLSGTELFIGSKKEEKFGYMVLCGLGGIFIEVLKDISYSLIPICNNEAKNMIKNLKSYKVIKGIRGQQGINEDIFADIIVRLSCLLEIVPEITELDLNPLLGNSDSITAIDARIRIHH